jgi:hypothetical protein
MNPRIYTLMSLLLIQFALTEMHAQQGKTCPLGNDLVVTIAAAPDLDTSRPGSQVRIGTTALLSGTSTVTSRNTSCDETTTPTPLNWSLVFQAPGGPETDITSQLSTPVAQTPDTPSTTSFRADSEGVYRARIRGGTPLVGFTTREVVIEAVQPPPVLTALCGRVTFLRANDVGGRFGPAEDSIDVEVVTKLTSAPADAMGFQLRRDDNRPVRSGMLDLLRDAFTSGGNVCLDYLIIPGKHNGIITRVALTKDAR